MKDISEVRLQYIEKDRIYELGLKRGRVEMALIVLPFFVVALIGIIIMLN